MNKAPNNVREIIYTPSDKWDAQQEETSLTELKNDTLSQTFDNESEEAYNSALESAIYGCKDFLEDKKDLLPGYISAIKEKFPEEFDTKEEWEQFLSSADQFTVNSEHLCQKINDIEKGGDSRRLKELREEASELDDVSKKLLQDIDNAISKEEEMKYELYVNLLCEHILRLGDCTRTLHGSIKGYEKLHQDEQHNE